MTNPITCIQCGDYQIPNLSLPTEKHYPIGKYGMLRKTYLKQNRKGLHNQMLLQGTLYDHLQKIDDDAHRLISRYVQEMAVREGVDESLKAKDQMEWVQRMNGFKAMAEEIVMHELIFDHSIGV